MHLPVLLIVASPQLRNGFRANIPHASQQLDQTAVGVGEGNDNVGLLNTASLHVDGRKDKRGQGESAQSQGSGVGELAVLVGAEDPRLQRAAGGHGQALLVGEGMAVMVVVVGAVGARVLFDGRVGRHVCVCSREAGG